MARLNPLDEYPSGAKEMAKAVAPVRGMASNGPMHRMIASIMSIAGVPPSLWKSPSFLSIQEEASKAYMVSRARPTSAA